MVPFLVKITLLSGKLSKTATLIAGILLICLVGAVDVLSGIQASVSIFYLLPVAWGAWRGDRRLGAVLALTGGLVGFYADDLTFRIYAHPIIPYWNMFARMSVYFLVACLILELRSRLENEETLARTDALTGASNSRHFYAIAEQEMERARRNGQPITIAYMDLDNFKSVNDSFGHTTGDDLLRLVADVIKKNIRTMDVFARLGGDEFAVLMPETGGEAAQQVLNRLRNLLMETMRQKGWPVTFSIGIVTFDKPPDSVEEMVQRLDALMYSGKNAGKDVIRHEVVKSPWHTVFA